MQFEEVKRERQLKSAQLISMQQREDAMSIRLSACLHDATQSIGMSSLQIPVLATASNGGGGDVSSASNRLPELIQLTAQVIQRLLQTYSSYVSRTNLQQQQQQQQQQYQQQYPQQQQRQQYGSTYGERDWDREREREGDFDRNKLPERDRDRERDDLKRRGNSSIVLTDAPAPAPGRQSLSLPSHMSGSSSSSSFSGGARRSSSLQDPPTSATTTSGSLPSSHLNTPRQHQQQQQLQQQQFQQYPRHQNSQFEHMEMFGNSSNMNIAFTPSSSSFSAHLNDSEIHTSLNPANFISTSASTSSATATMLQSRLRKAQQAFSSLRDDVAP